MKKIILFFSFVFALVYGLRSNQNIDTKKGPFPLNLRGNWFSWEDGKNTVTHIDQNRIKSLGEPLVHTAPRYDVLDYIFKRNFRCILCVRFVVRSWNVLERFDSTCSSYDLLNDDLKWFKKRGCQYLFNMTSVQNVQYGKKIDYTQKGHIMYRENESPIPCRNSVYGNFRLAYQVQDSFTGECESYGSKLTSCDQPGTQFFISNQKFLLQFKPCQGIKNSLDSEGEFMCLGVWREGLQQYFVAANLGESRKEERYRCFLKNREDPYYIGMSRSPSCSFLRTPENSPVRLRLTPIQKVIESTCLFPANLTGRWVSSGHGEPHVLINSTHIIESRWVGHQLRKDISACIENRQKRFLMAKVSEFGCQTEYVCWEILPRHQNIVRFRRSRALIQNSFHVCDYGNFQNSPHWKYDTLIREIPEPIQCPFSGRFSFGQRGSTPLRSRIPNGITKSPLDTYHCTIRETELSICDRERKRIVIDLDYCLTLNEDGHSVDFNRISDYRLNCVGFWKENLLSYLITHDPFDSVSKFRCWVYQRISITQIRLSKGLGSACGLYQHHSSYKLKEGASLAINLTLKERLHDQCPLYFDDGRNPWMRQTSDLKVFRFKSEASNHFSHNVILVFLSFSILLTDLLNL